MAEQETRDQLGKRTDELARGYAETHDEQVKAEIEALSLNHRNLSLKRDTPD